MKCALTIVPTLGLLSLIPILPFNVYTQIPECYT